MKTTRKPRKKTTKDQSVWKKKLVHKWSWLGALVGFFVGAPVWAALALWLWNADTSSAAAAILIDNWARESTLIAIMALLLGRLVAIARWPRKPPLDYNKITFPGVLAANALTIVIGAALLICTLALVAPGVLELMAEHW